MISSLSELKYFLDADRFSLNRTNYFPSLFDSIWRYQRNLRYLEFCLSSNNFFVKKIFSQYFKFRKNRLGFLLGFDIPPFVFGPGLNIVHHGLISVNAKARVGSWCEIHQGVNIGTALSVDGQTLAPKIGDHCWIGPGAKIFGDINIGDSCLIGTNSVVNRSVEDKVTCIGSPFKSKPNGGSTIFKLSISECQIEYFYIKYPHYLKFKKKFL